MEKKPELPATTNSAQLTTYVPGELSQDIRDLRTVRDVLALVEQNRGAFPSLARLRADFGSDKIETVIKLHLIDLRENLNLKRPLRDNQIDNIAREIVAEFYTLTIPDVYLVFRQAKTGIYGDFYDSLDMPKVMQWFRQYFEDRCQAAAQDSINSAGKYRTEDSRRDSERWAQYFDRMNKNNKKG